MSPIYYANELVFELKCLVLLGTHPATNEKVISITDAEANRVKNMFCIFYFCHKIIFVRRSSLFQPLKGRLVSGQGPNTLLKSEQIKTASRATGDTQRPNGAKRICKYTSVQVRRRPNAYRSEYAPLAEYTHVLNRKQWRDFINSLQEETEKL